MPETTRTFLAIAIPRPLDEAVLGLQASLARETAACRWTNSLPFHITLSFLGDVRTSDLDQLAKAISAVTDAFEPFELSLEGLGAFPTVARPRVIWAGVVAPNMKPLIDIQAAVVDAISANGYRPEDLRFHPHVTLGRTGFVRHGQSDLRRSVERYQGWSAGPFSVEEISIFESSLGPGGPVYTLIRNAQLKSKKS